MKSFCEKCRGYRGIGIKEAGTKMDSQEPSGHEVAEFIQGAFRLEQLRQDIATLFQVIGKLPESLDPAGRLGLLCEARAALARAVKEERRTTAEQASRTPRIMRYSIEAAHPAPAPTPAPVQRYARPASIEPPADDMEEIETRRSSERRERPSYRVMRDPTAQPTTEEVRAASLGSINSAIDRIFGAEIHSNVSSIPSAKDGAAEPAPEKPAPPAPAVSDDGLNASLGPAFNLKP
jgi:hypothetical protein